MFGVRAAIATVVLLCVLGVGIVYFVFQTGKEDPYRLVKVAEYSPPAEIVIQHTLQDGTHTYWGALPLASACNSLSSGIAANGTSTMHVKVSLVVLEPKLPCSQEDDPFDQEFSVSFVSTESAPVFSGVTVNGVEVAYRLTETP